MASINYAARQISVKIVYYGPGLSGKTTNLQVIHKKTPQEHKSDMVSLATETDRTLFFDFLPLDLGKIKQFDTKFQLYTVPGQVYYNATRKLVLRGVDGVVFVADSGADKIQENLESFQNLEDNLAEYGYQRDSIPIILQYNKRDLPNALPIDELNRHVNKYNLPWGEGIAYKGVGVFDTLKQIGKIVIDHLNKKYSRSGGGRAAAPAAAPSYQQYAAAPSPAPSAYTPPAPPAYQPPPPPVYTAPAAAAPAYQPPPQQQYGQQAYGQPVQSYAAAQPYQAPSVPQYQAPPAQSYAAPSAPAVSAWEQSFEISAAPAAAVTEDPFYIAPAQSIQTFEKPTVAQPVVEDPFFIQQAPQQQNIPSFEFNAAPATPVQQSAPANYDDAFMVEPPQAAQSMPAASQGGFQQSPFEFEMPPPPATMGGSQQTIAPTGGGSEFNFAPAPQAAPAQEPSFDYQSFVPSAQAAPQQSPFAFDAPAADVSVPVQPPVFDFGAPIELSAPAAPAAHEFGAPVQVAGYDPFTQPAATVPAAPHSGKSELDLEIEKYQREIEEKQRSMRSGGMPPPQAEPQVMQPYPPGSGSQVFYQPQYAPPATEHDAFSDFEAELEGRNVDNAQNGGGLGDYPSDSAMFFTSVDRNTAMLKKSGKPPVNPAKKTAQQQSKGLMAKFLNKDKQG